MTLLKRFLIVTSCTALILISACVVEDDSSASETKGQTAEEVQAILQEMNEGLPSKVHDRVRADSVAYVEKTLIYYYTVFNSENNADDPYNFREIETMVDAGIDYVAADKCSHPEWGQFLKSGGRFKLVFRSDQGDSIAQYLVGIEHCESLE